ncbi:MAG: DUF3482 domain-containing protein [Verrucomicrobiales bacterium]|nr:DUF3482 domain-containing protein [Verrucomicrobiales bacterium]
MPEIVLSLISHTNVGKTALARTLLRQDVGEVADRAHVTVVSEAFDLIETEQGGETYHAKLWDTPGFGSNLAKLAARLKSSNNPVGWILHQVWDRVSDKSLWCSQEAIRNISEDADVVIYLVDASQSPATIGYVDLEMEILDWIGKPVIVFLNQTGKPDPDKIISGEAEWRSHLAEFKIVKNVSTLDAFTRCWVLEHTVLERAAGVLDGEKARAAQILAEAWKARNLGVFEQATEKIAALMAESACDAESLSEKSLLEKVKGLLRSLTDRDPELEKIQQTMYARLATRTGTTINELIELHGLDGETAKKLAKHSREEFAVRRDVEESLATAVGGAVSGLAGGLAADLASGGMTFGGGAVVGALLGGATTYALAKGFNLTQSEQNSVRWSGEHFLNQVEFVLMLYLGVAHFGRGRGVWRDPENNPTHWESATKAAVENHKSKLLSAWEKAPKRGGEKTAAALEKTFRDLLVEILAGLYPEQKSVFE